MSISGTLVLPADVTIVPVDSYPDHLRTRIGAAAGEFAVTRRGTRAPTVLVDERIAQLLEAFREPTTVIDAIHARSTSLYRAEQLLRESFPMLAFCYNADILVRAGAASVARIEPTLPPGGEFGRFRIVGAIRALNDTEVYRAQDRRTGRHVALKLARPGVRGSIRDMLAHEAEILRTLDGVSNAPLAAHGKIGRTGFLATQWCSGRPIMRVADALRADASGANRERLAALCVAVIRAYAHVHEQDVLHCDVHAGNVLVTPRGNARLIDFGIALRVARRHPLRHLDRAAPPASLEPEYVRASLEGLTRPEPSVAGEQYAIAAMLYEVLTGKEYLDFSLVEATAYRQIAYGRPLPFARRGVVPWPELESALGKALSKAPADRFASVSDFADAVSTAARTSASRRVAASGRKHQATPRSPTEPWSTTLLAPLFDSADSAVSDVWAAPNASVQFGAAGGAVALLHLAAAQRRTDCLAYADVWAERAVLASSSSAAFANPARGIHHQLIGRGSLFHGRAGVYATQALVARALGNRRVQGSAISQFVASSLGSHRQFDLTLGTAGILYGCAALVGVPGELPPELRTMLIDHGNMQFTRLWDRLDAATPLTARKWGSATGMAHGWAGLLYASLAWSLVTDVPLAQALYDRLLELAALGRPAQGGLVWPERLGVQKAGPIGHAGWCSGSAGYIHLWTLAFEVLREQRFLDLAERAGRTAGNIGGDAVDLCCGLAGRAYSLLNLYRYTGGAEWLRNAKVLTARAIVFAKAERGNLRLYKGPLGVVTLEADLETPHDARMPFFELEGWSR